MSCKPCVLVLEDGTEFAGYNFGSNVLPVDGEVGMLLFEVLFTLCGPTTNVPILI
jgi:hypothetical protein